MIAVDCTDSRRCLPRKNGAVTLLLDLTDESEVEDMLSPGSPLGSPQGGCRRFYYDVIKRLVARWIALFFLLSAAIGRLSMSRSLLQDEEIGENGREPS